MCLSQIDVRFFAGFALWQGYIHALGCSVCSCAPRLWVGFLQVRKRFKNIHIRLNGDFKL